MGRGGDLRIRLLGGFSVTVGKRAVDPGTWTRKHPRALVSLLALTPGHRLHREQIIDALWPDLDPTAAGNNLRKALHLARRALGDGSGEAATLIVGRGEALALAPDAWVDVEVFEAGAASARRSGDPAAYEEALAAYGGDLLPEDRYEHWVMTRADELKREMVASLV